MEEEEVKKKKWMSSKLDSAQISFLRVILNCVKNLRVEEERNGTKKKSYGSNKHS